MKNPELVNEINGLSEKPEKRLATTRFETKKTGGEGNDASKKVSKASKSTGLDQTKAKSAAIPKLEVSDAEIPQKSGEVGYKKPPVHTQFGKGNNANPGGKPVGSRNKLQGDFMRELCEDFAANGRGAIIACRTDKPDVYVKVIASLMPKEFEIKRPLEDLSEDELIAGVAALQSFLASSGDGVGVIAAAQRKQTH